MVQLTNTTSDGHLVLYDVPWDTYTRVMELFVDRRLRHTYSRGTLELMAPLKRHDPSKSLLGRFIETLAYELDIPIQSIGSTTLRREDLEQGLEQGLEPDECFYIANESAVRDKSDFDPLRDPVPDLAVEVDVTNRSLSRLDVYARLGVPEVWRYDGRQLTIHRLRPSPRKYVSIGTSIALPWVMADQVSELLEMRGTIDDTTLVKTLVKSLLPADRATKRPTSSSGSPPKRRKK